MKYTKGEKRCLPLFALQPQPTIEEQGVIASQVGLSRRSVQRALAKYRLEIIESNKKSDKLSSKSKGKGAKGKKPKKAIAPALKHNKMPFCTFKDLQDAVANFIFFVGFRGYIVNGCPVLDQAGQVHKGEAVPAPIDEKGQYLGILQHEVDGFTLAYVNIKKGVMFKWPRGHGKTYLVDWLISWTMKCFAWPWLYMSVTDVIGDVADWIYRWAKTNNYIALATRGGKRNTYTQFELHNGAKLKIFDYMAEKMVGKHGWYLAFDDVVKRKWEDKPTENLKAKRQWLHSIKWMRIKGILIFGTRKFNGDLLEFLEQVIKGLIIDVKTPYVMVGAYPDWRPLIDPTTGQEVIWVPELFTWDDIEDKKTVETDDGTDPYLAFMAEMMQDTRPREGGTWQISDLVYKNSWAYRQWDAVAIAADTANTVKDTSDYTGIVVVLAANVPVGRGGKTRYEYLVIRAMQKKVKMKRWVEEVSGGDDVVHKGVLDLIEGLFRFCEDAFSSAHIIVPIETNNGGILYIEEARNNADVYSFAGSIVEVTHSTVKKAHRIEGELYSTIKNKRMKFLDILMDGDLEDQILIHPNNLNDDIIDALGMAKAELARLRRKNSGHGRAQAIKEASRERRERGAKDAFDMQGLKGIRGGSKSSARGSMF